MTLRPQTRLLSALALFGLVACGGSADSGQSGATSGSGSGGDAASSDSSASGVIFKGPMLAGSTITITPYDDALEVAGAPQVFTVDGDDGSYAITLDHVGFVLIEAEGLAHSEVSGDVPEETVHLQAWGELGTDSILNLNVVTDALSVRIKNDLRAGMDLGTAYEQAEEDFHAALGWSDRPEPESTDGIDPYDGGYEAAWLLAVSGVISQGAELEEHELAPEDDEEREQAVIAAFLENLREGFAAEGAFSPEVHATLVQAERTMDPDLAVLGFTAHFEDYGYDYPTPDVHQALDTDGDGVLNADDNCRFIANADQAPHAEGDFGAACDLRAASISTGETYGCAVMAEDGRLECWDVLGEPTGGTPPHPQRFPAHEFIPWEDIPGTTFDEGGYVQFEIRNSSAGMPGATTPPPRFLACGRKGDGRTSCWVPDAPLTVLSGFLGELTLSDDRICASVADEPLLEGVLPTGTACFSTSGGPPLFLLPQTFTDLAVAEDDSLCGIDATGAVSCFDANGIPAASPFAGSYQAIAANVAPGVDLRCALTAADGSVECHGGPDISTWTGGDELLSHGDFVELVVGRGVVCAATAEGELRCANNEDLSDPELACPMHEPPPPTARALTAEGCVVCGIDDDGFGDCWPRNWAVRRGEGALSRPE